MHDEMTQVADELSVCWKMLELNCSITLTGPPALCHYNGTGHPEQTTTLRRQPGRRWATLALNNMRSRIT